jgi:hypothetical protein
VEPEPNHIRLRLSVGKKFNSLLERFRLRLKQVRPISAVIPALVAGIQRSANGGAS